MYNFRTRSNPNTTHDTDHVSVYVLLFISCIVSFFLLFVVYCLLLLVYIYFNICLDISDVFVYWLLFFFALFLYICICC